MFRGCFHTRFAQSKFRSQSSQVPDLSARLSLYLVLCWQYYEQFAFVINLNNQDGNCKWEEISLTYLQTWQLRLSSSLISIFQYHFIYIITIVFPVVNSGIKSEQDSHLNLNSDCLECWYASLVVQIKFSAFLVQSQRGNLIILLPPSFFVNYMLI